MRAVNGEVLYGGQPVGRLTSWHIEMHTVADVPGMAGQLLVPDPAKVHARVVLTCHAAPSAAQEMLSRHEAASIEIRPFGDPAKGSYFSPRAEVVEHTAAAKADGPVELHYELRAAEMQYGRHAPPAD